MSHKSTRRSRKTVDAAIENGNRKLCVPEPQKAVDVKDGPADEREDLKGFTDSEIMNSKSLNENLDVQTSSDNKTPSRSSTPQATVGGQDESEVLPDTKAEEDLVVVVPEDTDEVVLELQFDDSELEVESEGSPNRCTTRRSHSRNLLSTPKTPKADESGQMGRNEEVIESPPTPNLNGQSESCAMENGTHRDSIELSDSKSESLSSVSTDNLSTKATVGSDSTRNVDLSCQDSGALDENNSFWSAAKDRTMGETLRGLSSRRTIRPLTSSGSDYRKLTLIKTTLDKQMDLSSLTMHSNVETFGMKRKNRSITPENPKRIKTEHTGFFSYITEPLQSIRNRFTREPQPKTITAAAITNSNSTPKATSYSDKEEYFKEDVSKIDLEVDHDLPSADGQSKWCLLM